AVRQPVLGTVSVYGTYSDKFFVADSVGIYDYNQLKYFASLIGLLIVLYYIYKDWMPARVGGKNA
ncbi:MAG: hypothetical protein ABIF10_01625, partial [Candidatus Woesearchaeota archaeon]